MCSLPALQTTRRRGLLGLQREPRTYKRYDVGKDDQVRVWKMWEEATTFENDLRKYQNSLSAFQASTAGLHCCCHCWLTLAHRP